MHRSPLLVYSHWGVNFFVFYFRMYGPMPHYTVPLTLDITVRANLATAGGLLRVESTCLLAWQKVVQAPPSTRPPGPNGGPGTRRHHIFFHENVLELSALRGGATNADFFTRKKCLLFLYYAKNC